jgi:very-short-patch-repair endonuclease
MIRAKHKSAPHHRQRAKELRRQWSPHEQKLWGELKLLNKATGFKFRRQHPLSPYIVDFICLEARLIIELDGTSHNTRQEYDQKRDAYLEWLGYKTMRFANQEFAVNKDGVIMAILSETKERAEVLAACNPSPAKTKGLRSPLSRGQAQAQVFASSPSRGEEE